MRDKLTVTLTLWCAAAGLWLATRSAALGSGVKDTTAAGPTRDERGGDLRDRGDVPGWVMITVMTAIVVIALLAVFREQVLAAVTNAFNSVSGAGGQP